MSKWPPLPHRDFELVESDGQAEFLVEDEERDEESDESSDDEDADRQRPGWTENFLCGCPLCIGAVGCCANCGTLWKSCPCGCNNKSCRCGLRLRRR